MKSNLLLERLRDKGYFAGASFLGPAVKDDVAPDGAVGYQAIYVSQIGCYCRLGLPGLYRLCDTLAD